MFNNWKIIYDTKILEHSQAALVLLAVVIRFNSYKYTALVSSASEVDVLANILHKMRTMISNYLFFFSKFGVVISIPWVNIDRSITLSCKFAKNFKTIFSLAYWILFNAGLVSIRKSYFICVLC